MALTNKQAAARIVKNGLARLESEINAMDSRSIASVAEKSRMSDDKATEVKEYAKAFLKPSLDRVNNICAKVDTPEGESEGSEEDVTVDTE